MKAANQRIPLYRRPWLIGVLVITILICSLTSLALYFPNQSPPVPCAVNGLTKHRDMVYAERPGFEPHETSLDLYLPQLQGDCPQQMPLVIWVHGGSFTGGDKALDVEYKKKLFTDQGWAFASVGYRLTSPERSVMHPGQANDVAVAIGWLYENRREYGLDTARTALVGYSAGAYLVSLVSTDNNYASREKYPPANVDCTVSLDTGAYDLPRYMQSDDGAVSVYRDILGTEEDRWRENSPLHLAGPARYLPDFLLVTRGEGVRPDISHSFARALRGEGVQANVLEAKQYSHSDLDALLGAPGDSLLTNEVMKFLRSCVYKNFTDPLQ